MKIAVCVKEVLDARVPLQVQPQTGEIVQLGTDRITLINPSDRAALEVALGLTDQNPNSRVEVFSVCEPDQQGALYFALARGADHVERLTSNARRAGPPYTAVLLASRFAGEKFDLIFCGDETLDNSSGMVGPLIAELLDLPQVAGVSRVRELRSNALLVERSLDRGHRELIEVELPALATFRPEAAELQYVSLRRIQQACKSEIPARQLEIDFTASKLPRWPDSERKVPPRARVKKKFAPDVNLPAAERVKMIMSGAIAPEPSSQIPTVLEGNPDYLTEQLFRFLKHHEFV